METAWSEGVGPDLEDVFRNVAGRVHGLEHLLHSGRRHLHPLLPRHPRLHSSPEALPQPSTLALETSSVGNVHHLMFAGSRQGA